VERGQGGGSERAVHTPPLDWRIGGFGGWVDRWIGG
jgi:hypothetical protein